MEKGRVLKKLKKVLIAMICTIVVVFSMPIKSKATIPEDIVDVLLKIPDGIMWLGNVFLSGRNSTETMEKINLKGAHFGRADEGHVYNFYITPYDIFCNGQIRQERDIAGQVTAPYRVLPIFYANFFKEETNTGTLINSRMNSIDILRPAISNVYKYLRNLAIVVMMLVLMYIGIRIIISSAATEQSKYKQMLIDWVVGLCLLFVMHYIMSFIMNVTDIIVDMLVADETQAYYIGFDELGHASDAGSGSGEEWYEFAQDYDDPDFIDAHFALRAVNDAWYSDGSKSNQISASDTHPWGLFSIRQSVYKWEEWENTLSKTDTSSTYTDNEYVKGEDVNESRSAIFMRVPDGRIATAKDRVLRLDRGGTEYNWGKDGTVTLNAIITQSKEKKDGRIPWYRHIAIYRGNTLEYIRTISSFGRKYVHIYDDNSETGFTKDNDSFMFSAGNAILYVVLVLETIMFVFIYFKRLLQLAFLTMIAPMVAFMYPLDKVGDGKAQAFNTWFKDYLFTALLQPFHLLLYTVFITAAIELTQKNIIYALAVYAFMIPAEKYFKKILGFEKSSTASGSGLAGAAGGLLAMRGFDKLAGLGPRGRGGKGGSGGGRTRIRLPRRSAGGGSGGGAPIGSGAGAAGTDTNGRRGTGGLFGNAARNAAGAAGRQSGTGAPNSSGEEKRKLPLPNGRRSIRGAISRGLTGGKFSSLRELNPKERRKAILGAVGGAAGRAALKNAGRAAGVAVLGTAGAMVGTATAIATGDASNIFKGALTGAGAGFARGGQLGNSAATGIGGLISDAQAYRAASDQKYADEILATDGIKQFSDNGIMLDDNEQEIVRAVSPYKDLKGDDDILGLYKKSFDEQKAEIQQANIDELMRDKGWDADTLEEKQQLLEKADSDLSADELADKEALKNAMKVGNDKVDVEQAVKDVSDAKTWGKLNEVKRQEDFINYEMNKRMETEHKDMKPPTEPEKRAEVTQTEIDTHASSIDESVARAAAEKERDARVDAIQEQIESLDETYDSRIEKANNRGDVARAKELEKSREKRRKELERQRTQEESRALDIEAKRKEMAKKELEDSRRAAIEADRATYEREMAEYNAVREQFRADAVAKLRRCMSIQEKMK